ncbi:hypothetical protein ACQ4PT_050124 [Festuca glaucescens]
MASGGDPRVVGEASVGPETRCVHDWVLVGKELRFAFLVNIRRDRYIMDAKKKNKFHGGFDYPLPMDYEADNDVPVVDDEVGEDEDLAAVEWDQENPQREEGSIFASMSECRNALVTYCIKAEHTFEVDKSDQVKVNPFRHTCEESTLRKETISRAKSRWVTEEVKQWVTENHQVGAKELQKNIKHKFKIELPYMRVFNGNKRLGNGHDSLLGYHSRVDPAFGESFDENVGPNEAPNVDPNEDENLDRNEDDPNDDVDVDPNSPPNVDPNSPPNDDPNEAPNVDLNEAPNDDPNEAPNDGGQPSVVVSSARFDEEV